jgi:DNA-binding MarR family transcriptional regulator
LTVKNSRRRLDGVTDAHPAEKYQAIPELMRLARGAYKRSADVRLAAAGLEDLPTSGGYLLAYLESGEQSIADMIRGLGFTKQAFSQLVDTMVLRGFITRDVDPNDRRRMTLRMTERGKAAAKASYEGCLQVDEELERRLTPEELAGLRKGLSVLAEIKTSLKSHAIRRGLARG